MDTIHGLARESLGLVHLATKFGPVIEIVDTATGSGKTHILYHIAALSTLPEMYLDTTLNGKAAAVIVLDNDGRFDVHRLRKIMESHIKRCCEGPNHVSEEDIASIIDSALMHIHIYHPSSSENMISILEEVFVYLLDQTKHHSGQRRLDAILIDSLGAFYWQDRMNELGPGSDGDQTGLGLDKTYRRLHEVLSKVCLKFGAFVVAANWGLRPINNLREGNLGTATNRSDRGCHVDLTSAKEVCMPLCQLPPSWSASVDYRFIVSRNRPPPFPHRITLENARRMQLEREGALRSIGFVGRLDHRSLRVELPPEPGWGGENGFKFHYQIAEQGILFANDPDLLEHSVV